MLDRNEIGKYLRKLRLEKNWTQAQLAEQKMICTKPRVSNGRHRKRT